MSEELLSHRYTSYIFVTCFFFSSLSQIKIVCGHNIVAIRGLFSPFVALLVDLERGSSGGQDYVSRHIAQSCDTAWVLPKCSHVFMYD